MLTPLQALKARGYAGDPLPVVWSSLADAGIKFMRGQLCLICAGPGTGKSAFALAYADKTGEPVLYFSADSDSFTQLSRLVAIRSGVSQDAAAKHIRECDTDAVYDALAGSVVRFDFSANPSISEIRDQIVAYAELYGEFPGIIVLDNITNVSDGGDEDGGLEGLMDWLHGIARTTSSLILCLHHVTGPFNDADKPIPLSGVKGQIGRVPEIILTLHQDRPSFGPPHLNVSPVKNRYGKADPSGYTFASLVFEGETMTIRDIGEV